MFAPVELLYDEILQAFVHDINNIGLDFVKFKVNANDLGFVFFVLPLILLFVSPMPPENVVEIYHYFDVK